MSGRRALVVGTTADYIGLICTRFPGRALFLTDAAERARAAESPPDPDTELLCDLTDAKACLRVVREASERGGPWTGVACFDCESLLLAAKLAGALSLPFPSVKAVAACRSKLHSKRLWQNAGVPCPKAEAVPDLAAVTAFRDRVRSPVVLKPLTGSGSELTFHCDTATACRQAFNTLRTQLALRRDNRMYTPLRHDHTTPPDPRRVFVVEEYVSGDEYSCDFFLEGNCLSVVRTARKIRATEATFGSTLAYVVPAELPETVEPGALADQVVRAAHALGLRRAFGMVDFIVSDGRAFLLEMTPRPGGDCLPPLIRQCCGLDVLGAALDFAEGRPVRVPEPSLWRRLVGLRLMTGRSGALAHIDAADLQADPRVVETHLKARPGQRIFQPPEDYESRFLGHVVFAPSAADLSAECAELAAKLHLQWGPRRCPSTTTS